jgi:hypothetical protein
MFAFVKPQLPLPAQLTVPEPESTVHKLAPRHCRGRVPVGETFWMYILVRVVVIPPRLVTVMLNVLPAKPVAPGGIAWIFSELDSWSRWVIEVTTPLYASNWRKFQVIKLKPMSMRITKKSPPKTVLIPLFARTNRR